MRNDEGEVGTLNYLCLLAAAALLAGGMGAALSHIPGKGGRTLLWGLLLAPLSAALFAGALCLRAGTAEPAAVLDRFFPDRLSKLTGCGLLLLLGCGLGLLFGALRAKGLRRWFRAAQQSRLHKVLVPVLLAVGAALVAGCVLLAGEPAPTPVRLTELGCANFQRADPDTGEFSDYIELCNTSDETVDLAGYFLSDNGKKRGRFRLPEWKLEPGACVLLWADGTGTSGQRGGSEAIHLNFSLKAGETLWFSSPHGVLLDKVTVPEPRKNVSMSLVDGEWTLTMGTPGRSNEDAVLYTPPSLEPPTLSLAAGFYDEPQTLTLTAASGCEIRYTLDGSAPMEKSPLYEGPLTLTDCSDQPNRVWSQPNTMPDRSAVLLEPVDKGTVLRAAAFGPDGAYSDPVTAVYFIGPEFAQYRDRAVLSLVVSPADLFGKYGIMVTGPAYDEWLAQGGVGQAPTMNLYRRGRSWERDAVLTLWDEDGALVLDAPCGARLQGDSSRVRVMKRFSLYARPVYGGSSLFPVPVFGDQLSHSLYTRANYNDVMAQSLCADLGLGGQAARSVVMFLNAELYGETFLRERYDKRWFLDRFGAEEDELVVIADSELDCGTAEDYAAFQALMDYIQSHDCADPAVWAEIRRQVDVENYAAYIAANLYLNNTDWSVTKNYRLWRVRTPQNEGVLDGRWRWLLFDMDACYWTRPAFGDAPRASYDLFHYQAPETEGSFLELPMFRELLQNPEFRMLFARTWLRLMNVEFSYERALPLLEALGLTEDPFWPEFLRTRPDYAVDQLIEALDLPGEACGLRLGVPDPAGGSLRLCGGTPELTGGTWTGTWVTGVPLTLSAEAAPGWRFAGWRGSAEGEKATLTLTPTGDTELTAVFEKIGS
ncbi:MAG: CotH kinase family protein [Oscillospiraceae bacterium]|nr:CotH kinase family protein [Oscillospiraceae bacterium]MBQ6159705.1 CotH kinase family protein [Oscillospiraceae bacterium]